MYHPRPRIVTSGLSGVENCLHRWKCATGCVFPNAGVANLAFVSKHCLVLFLLASFGAQVITRCGAAAVAPAVPTATTVVSPKPG